MTMEAIKRPSSIFQKESCLFLATVHCVLLIPGTSAQVANVAALILGLIRAQTKRIEQADGI
jgi:hypothetical protein